MGPSLLYQFRLRNEKLSICPINQAGAHSGLNEKTSFGL